MTGGASLGLPVTASITITEDDPPPLLDSNGDGILDVDAIALGLDPNDPDGDTDDDGSSDVDEVGGDLNNPLDSDVDGVIDALEPGAAAGGGSGGGGGCVLNISTSKDPVFPLLLVVSLGYLLHRHVAMDVVGDLITSPRCCPRA